MRKTITAVVIDAPKIILDLSESSLVTYAKRKENHFIINDIL